MFKLETNKKIGEYLGNLIDQKYKSQRAFCRAYISVSGIKQDETNLANHITQITKGNKTIQLYDLPIFSELLGVTCEQILSAGDCTVPVSDRVTNYYIASSKDSAEWEKYINRDDKLILNCDEYCKTVLDYALEFGNYDFLKYLMDNKYIWFDSRKNDSYITSFGAGTSVKRRDMRYIDTMLETKLFFEDELRLNLIALAVDNDDLEILDDLRARENPQLYYVSYLMNSDKSDFNRCYNERMVKHIASSGEKILDYFTDTFEIDENIKFTKGNKQHTFMFPYISNLLDFLISENSAFTETALKKALKHNKEAYDRFCKIIHDIKTNEHAAKIYSYDPPEVLKEVTIAICKKDLDFFEDGDIALFRSLESYYFTGRQLNNPIITNVARVTKIPASPILKHLAEELNESYEAIKNLKEHLEEI